MVCKLSIVLFCVFGSIQLSSGMHTLLLRRNGEMPTENHPTQVDCTGTCQDNGWEETLFKNGTVTFTAEATNVNLLLLDKTNVALSSYGTKMDENVNTFFGCAETFNAYLVPDGTDDPIKSNTAQIGLVGDEFKVTITTNLKSSSLRRMLTKKSK